MSLEFLDLMTFCHTDQNEKGEWVYVMNYLHWDHMERLFETRPVEESIYENVRKLYKRLYAAEGLLGQFCDTAHLKMALEKCGYYPERESKLD